MACSRKEAGSSGGGAQPAGDETRAPTCTSPGVGAASGARSGAGFGPRVAGECARWPAPQQLGAAKVEPVGGALARPTVRADGRAAGRTNISTRRQASRRVDILPATQASQCASRAAVAVARSRRHSRAQIASGQPPEPARSHQASSGQPTSLLPHNTSESHTDRRKTSTYAALFCPNTSQHSRSSGGRQNRASHSCSLSSGSGSGQVRAPAEQARSKPAAVISASERRRIKQLVRVLGLWRSSSEQMSASFAAFASDSAHLGLAAASIQVPHALGQRQRQHQPAANQQLASGSRCQHQAHSGACPRAGSTVGACCRPSSAEMASRRSHLMNMSRSASIPFAISLYSGQTVGTRRAKLWPSLLLPLILGCAIFLVAIWSKQISLVLNDTLIMILVLGSVFIIMCAIAFWLSKDRSLIDEHCSEAALSEASSEAGAGSRPASDGHLASCPRQRQRHRWRHSSQGSLLAPAHFDTAAAGQAEGEPSDLERGHKCCGISFIDCEPPDYFSAMRHSLPVCLVDKLAAGCLDGSSQSDAHWQDAEHDGDGDGDGSSSSMQEARRQEKGGQYLLPAAGSAWPARQMRPIPEAEEARDAEAAQEPGSSPPPPSYDELMVVYGSR